jgi:uncharacterized membrane protein YphA (DoxX/SURF4 family)
MTRHKDIAILLLRLAIAFNFLSAVASRFGLWPNGSNWQKFVQYTGEVNSFAPKSMIPFLAVAATSLELIFALLLFIGLFTRWAALGSAILTLLFALAMSYSFGVKEALDYSVFVDCTSAFLLAAMNNYRWSLDNYLLNRKPYKTQLYETANGL